MKNTNKFEVFRWNNHSVKATSTGRNPMVIKDRAQLPGKEPAFEYARFIQRNLSKALPLGLRLYRVDLDVLKSMWGREKEMGFAGNEALFLSAASRHFFSRRPINKNEVFRKTDLWEPSQGFRSLSK